VIDLFQRIEGGVAIISASGRYAQAEVYRRGSEVFVLLGKHYVRLRGANSTSVPKTLWHDIEAEGVLINKLGAPEWFPDPAATLG
jgi:hypothetical protein